MLPDNLYSLVLYNAWDTLWNMLKILLFHPTIVIMISGYIAIKTIKSIVGKVIRDFAYVSGCTKKEATRKVKKVHGVIDLLSVIGDINSYSKKH